MLKKKVLSVGKVKASENKQQKFKRLASFRLQKAIEAIQNISNLSVKSNYDYTESQIVSIQESLNDAVSNCIKRFQNGGKTTNGFTL